MMPSGLDSISTPSSQQGHLKSDEVYSSHRVYTDLAVKKDHGDYLAGYTVLSHFRDEL